MGISVEKSCRLHFPPLQLRFHGTQLHSLSSTSSITPLSSSPSPLPPNPKSILLDIFSAFIPYMLKKKKKNPHTMLQNGPTINSWPPILTEISMLPIFGNSLVLILYSSISTQRRHKPSIGATFQLPCIFPVTTVDSLGIYDCTPQ